MLQGFVQAGTVPSKQHAWDLPGWKKFRQESESLLSTAVLNVREQALAHFPYRDEQMLHLVLDLQREAVLPWNNKLKEKPKAGRGQPRCSGWYIPCLLVTFIFCSLLNSRASAREMFHIKTPLTSWKEMPLSMQTWADRAFLYTLLLPQARGREISLDVLIYLKAMKGTWEK